MDEIIINSKIIFESYPILEETFYDFIINSIENGESNMDWKIKPVDNYKSYAVRIREMIDSRPERKSAPRSDMQNDYIVVKGDVGNVVVAKSIGNPQERKYLRMIRYVDKKASMDIREQYLDLVSDYIIEIFYQIMMTIRLEIQGYFFIPRIEKVYDTCDFYHSGVRLFANASSGDSTMGIGVKLEDAGTDCSDIIRRCVPISVEDKVKFFNLLFCQILETTYILSKHDIIHGDLHAPNVALKVGVPVPKAYNVLKYKDTVRIFDFDFSCLKPDPDKPGKEWHPFNYETDEPARSDRFKKFYSYACNHPAQDPMLFFLSCFRNLFIRCTYATLKGPWEEFMIAPYNTNLDKILNNFMECIISSGDIINQYERPVVQRQYKYLQEECKKAQKEGPEKILDFIIKGGQSSHYAILHSRLFLSDFYKQSAESTGVDLVHVQEMKDMFTPRLITPRDFQHINKFTDNLEFPLSVRIRSI